MGDGLFIFIGKTTSKNLFVYCFSLTFLSTAKEEELAFNIPIFHLDNFLNCGCQDC